MPVIATPALAATLTQLAATLTPQQKAEGTRAALAELGALYESRLSFINAALGLREICQHFDLPWPFNPGELDDSAAIARAIDLYAGMAEAGALLWVPDAELPRPAGVIPSEVNPA